jgi:hypothetical protein
MGFRFEFDPANKILLFRCEGRLTDESLAEYYRAARKYSTATDASVGIFDSSLVTDFAVSSEFIRALANQEPAMPDAFKRLRFIVAPTTVGFGLARMFQTLGEPTRPLLKVVHTLDEALAALGIQSPQFELLE